MVNFGKRLKMLRKESRMTQDELARKLNVTKSIISYYELGDRTPTTDILIKLAYIFNVSTDYLLGVKHGRILDVTGVTDREIAIITSLIDNIKKSHNS